MLCAEEDEPAASSLCVDGVLPDAERDREEICIEADGTSFRLQKAPEGSPGRCEVKAMVAYEGEEVRSGKVRRRGWPHGRICWQRLSSAPSGRHTEDANRQGICPPQGHGKPR